MALLTGNIILKNEIIFCDLSARADDSFEREFEPEGHWKLNNYYTVRLRLVVYHVIRVSDKWPPDDWSRKGVAVLSASRV